MAEADGGGGKDFFIEGWVRDGKSVEQMQSIQTLREAEAAIKKEDAEIKGQLNKAQEALQDLSSKLSRTNDDLVLHKQQLEAKHSEQKFSLDGDRQKKLSNLTREAINDFLGARPESIEHERAVDVHFFAGEEGRTGTLFSGGEGAGSHDAKFKVQLRQSVKDLSDQAAKYWGLNPEQVFFLDRDGRIVPDDMRLNDIILPPVSPTATAGEGAQHEGDVGAGVGSMEPIQENQVALQSEPQSTALKSYVVKGRDYSLTLVRASTVLDKEDLEKPRGEQPVDFTFDVIALNEDLENTRKKRRDDAVTVQRAQLDDIPSLHALVQKGHEVKRKRHIDTAKRCFEVIVFLMYYVLFWVLLEPAEVDLLRDYGAVQHILDEMGTFMASDTSRPGLSTFHNITTFADYEDWIHGPVERTIQEDTLRPFGLYPVGITMRRYTAGSIETIDGFDYCGDVFEDNTTTGTTSEAFNTTSTSTTESSTTSLTTSTSTSTTTAPDDIEGNPTVTMTTTRTGLGCVDPALARCKSSRVVTVLDAVMQLGYSVPPCVPLYQEVVQDQLFRMGDPAFSWVQGTINDYAGGENLYVNRTNVTALDIDDLRFDTDGTTVPALSLVLFTYNPTMNAVHVLKFLTEFSPTASVIPSVHGETVKLSGLTWWETLVSVFVFLGSCLCLLMELGRALNNPFNTGEQKDGCTKWTLVFLTMPVLIATSVGLLEFRTAESSVSPIAMMLSESVDDYNTAVDTLYEWALLDYYTNILNLVILLLLNMLLVRYALVFFPQLRYVTQMVRTLMPSIVILVVLAAFAFFLLGLWPYGTYSGYEFKERTLLFSVITAVKVASGREELWFRLFEESGTIWAITSLVAFVAFTLILDNMPIVVMVSHLKEKSLRENYSYHHWWGLAKSKEKLSEDKLNPAKLGWDFTNPRKPKEPKEQRKISGYAF
mmetsp:Transcript_46313/g.107776  ORF Transcript_46313/g.107776 Transcript_46313/m.107776 type:complete len:936 (+) Transcript_46313:105-2912(+)